MLCANGGRTCFDFIYIRYVCHVQRILPKSQKKKTVKKTPFCDAKKHNNLNRNFEKTSILDVNSRKAIV